MGKNRSYFMLRLIISVGIILFVVNSAFFYIESSNQVFLSVFLISSILQILLGVAVVCLALKLTKKAYQFFIGLLLAGWGILSCLITFILPYDDSFWWPLYLIEAGIFIFLAGVVKYKSVKFGFLFPTLSLLIMGIWFSLFSFKILKVPFKTVVVLLGPAFIAFVAISLVIVFFIQQRHKEFIITDEVSGDFDDEELSFPKLD